MTELQTGLNIIFNCARIWWEYLTSDSIPLVVRMLFLAPFVIAIVALIGSVFGGSLSGGKTDL